MNFHDKTMDLIERFYCKAIPNAKYTCNAARNSTTLRIMNLSKYLGYSNLAFTAFQKKKDPYKNPKTNEIYHSKDTIVS